MRGGVLKQSFGPIVDDKTRLLILGSLPGDRSLEERRYYAHHTNRFWQLVGAVIGVDLAALAYADRLVTLLAHRIGLWDVVARARREGSGDSNIRDAETNDLLTLVERLPRLTAIAFNGSTSAKIGMRALRDRTEADLIALPSSSGLCAIPAGDKIARWLVLQSSLED